MVPWHFGQVRSMPAERGGPASSSRAYSTQWWARVGIAGATGDTGPLAVPTRWEHVLDKVVATTQEAVADVVDGASLAVGGFGLCGVPIALIDALLERGVRNLTTISNNCGVDDQALGVLLYAGRITRTISSFDGGQIGRALCRERG